MRYISEALDQNTGICKEALQDCASKLSKSFESVIIEVLLLYMVIPGKINFTQTEPNFNWSSFFKELFGGAA